jgi:hypothetical protein
MCSTFIGCDSMNLVNDHRVDGFKNLRLRAAVSSR